MTLEEILAGESKNLEFKVRRPKDSIKYMKSVVAFANGEGGRIIFGVDDKTHQVEGIPGEQVFSEIDAITEAISDSCEPAIIPDVYLQTLEGKTIIIADISEGRQRPYFIKSLGKEAGVYVRVAGTSRPADEYMIKELMLEGSSRSFDQITSTGWNVTDDEINALCAEIMLMCHKVTHKNLIDSSPLFRYYLTHTPCNFFVKPIDSDTSEEI